MGFAGLAAAEGAAAEAAAAPAAASKDSSSSDGEAEVVAQASAETAAPTVTQVLGGAFNSACCGTYGVSSFCNCDNFVPSSIHVPAKKVLTVVKKCKDKTVSKPKVEMVT